MYVGTEYKVCALGFCVLYGPFAHLSMSYSDFILIFEIQLVDWSDVTIDDISYTTTNPLSMYDVSLWISNLISDLAHDPSQIDSNVSSTLQSDHPTSKQRSSSSSIHYILYTY